MPDATVEISRGWPHQAEEVWEFATSAAGSNDEFRPWPRMTMPPGLPDAASLGDVALGEPLGRSWACGGGGRNAARRMQTAAACGQSGLPYYFGFSAG